MFTSIRPTYIINLSHNIFTLSSIFLYRLELGKCKVALFVLTFALTVSVGIVIGFLVDKYPRSNEDPLVVETNSLYTTGNISSNSGIKYQINIPFR